MNSPNQVSRAASAPGLLTAIARIQGLTPNGTHFVIHYVSGIGLTPPGSPLLSETSTSVSYTHLTLPTIYSV